MNTPVRPVAFVFPEGVAATVKLSGALVPPNLQATASAATLWQARFPALPAVDNINVPNVYRVNVDAEAPGYSPYLPVLDIPNYRLGDPLPANWDICIGVTFPPAPNRMFLPGMVPTMPPVPSRAQLCQAQLTFQGLTVQTQQFGTLPWFEPCIGWFTGPTAAADRQAVYAVKRAAGDQVIQIALSGQYAEPGQAYQTVPGKDFSQDLGGLVALVTEVVQNGFYVDLRLAGDGEGAGPGYNDPQGMTYGHDWLMANFPRVVLALGNLCEYIRFCPGYDSVFYGWDPSEVGAFGNLFRSLLPNGVLTLEFSIGVCHLGNGIADYQPGGGLYPYDRFEGEFDTSVNQGHNDALWQIAARMLGPAYVRPSDQPSGDDPSPPYYLGGGTTRGPYYPSGFEDWLYEWVRNGVSLGTIQNYRSYKRSIGYTLVG